MLDRGTEAKEGGSEWWITCLKQRVLVPGNSGERRLEVGERQERLRRCA